MADQAQTQKAKTVTTQPDTFSEDTTKNTPVATPEYPSFAKIVGNGITQCMKDRRNLQETEKVIHGWILCATPEEIREAKLQIETGKLVMESLFITFRQMSGQ
jgi:hypothetical protein